MLLPWLLDRDHSGLCATRPSAGTPPRAGFMGLVPRRL